MECPNCKQELQGDALQRAIYNVDTYGDSLIVATSCCNSAVKLVRPAPTVVAHKYEGDAKEDSYGVPIED